MTFEYKVSNAKGTRVISMTPNKAEYLRELGCEVVRLSGTPAAEAAALRAQMQYCRFPAEMRS